MKIFCIGRNYINHAKELNNPVPTEPLIFCKPVTALLRNNNPFYHPDFTNEIHHEVELVLRICRNGKHIEERFAHKYYDRIAVGIDFTARDVQNRLKQAGHPWEIAKGFDASAPISNFTLLSDFPNLDINNIDFSLTKNGKTVQQGNTSQLIFNFNYIIHYISKYFTVQQGDYIFTGTPAGVAPIAIGDELRAFIGNQELLRCEVR